MESSLDARSIERFVKFRKLSKAGGIEGSNRLDANRSIERSENIRKLAEARAIERSNRVHEWIDILKIVWFLLRVNVIVLIINFSAACLTGLTVVQLLWVNKLLPNNTTYKKHPPLSLRPNTKTHHTLLTAHHNSHHFLCRILLLITTAAVTADASGGSKKGSSGLTAMVVGIVIAVILFVVFLLFCYKFCAKKRFQKLVKVQDPEIGNYSIDILLEVTDNFSDENILGKGGYGVVYKGELHDGTKIAVKRMEVGLISKKRLKAFQNEIDVLTNVRHRHLVQLRGNCVDGNERLLVYEYMSQGTLSQHLFECPEQKTTLCWKQRASIALDVARGVEYLHGFAQEIFIHRDLKPSNILLDDAMRAKVSDFGLVKKARNRDGSFSFDSKLTGTVGYLSPEYAATGIATTKVDLYAFGVVLMQLITGRKALDVTMPLDSIQLAEWFHRTVLISRENILKAIDKTLDIDDEETVESIFKVAELAGRCTEREPDKRPDMGYVVNVLGPLVEEWASRSTLTS